MSGVFGIKFEEVKETIKQMGNLEDILDKKLDGYQAKINGVWYQVPIDKGNRQYTEIIRQFNNGTLDIKPADDGDTLQTVKDE
jgi:hypothetical protein